MANGGRRLGRHQEQAHAPSGWEWALFRAGDRSYYGSCWRHWGLHRTADGWYRVVHLPSGRSLTNFDRLRIARRCYDNPDCGSAVVKLASALAAAIREQRSVIAAFASAGGPS